MSDKISTNFINAQLQAAKELNELKKKELELKKHQTEIKYQEMLEAKEQLKAMEAIDITTLSKEYLERLVNKSKSYFKGSKTRAQFMVNIEDFNVFVPFFPKNLIVIGAVTGEGKSTGCANLAYSQLLQGRRPLIITNEESAEDVYNRVASLILGIRYGNHDSMPDDHADSIHDLLTKLPSRMRVIDDAYGIMNGHAISSTTTSIEGLEFIFEQLLRKQAEGFVYDSVIIDYFQNFSESKKNPTLDPVKVLTKVSSKLDQFKNSYNAPIVVFAQLKANTSEGSELSAKERIEWCKGLVNKATCFLEMKAIKKESATQWIIHKSRWNDYPDNYFITGWEKGKYVKYTEEFKKKVAQAKLDRFNKELEKKKEEEGKDGSAGTEGA